MTDTTAASAAPEGSAVPAAEAAAAAATPVAPAAAPATRPRRTPAAMQKRLEEPGASPLLRRLAGVEMNHASLNAQDRTVDMIISSGAAVRRFDYQNMREYDEVLSMEPSAIRLDRLNAGAPLLDSHDYWMGLEAMIGAVVPGSARVEKGQLIGTAKFSTSPEGDRAFQDCQQGVLRHVSVGYMTYAEEMDDSTDPPTYLATDWEPYEVSAVPMPADPKAGFRSAVTPAVASPRAQPASQERGTMTTQTPGADKQPAASAEALAAARATWLAEERSRTAGIREVSKRLGLPAEFADQHVEKGTALDEFRSAAIDKVAETAAARGIEVGAGSLGAPAIIGRHKTVEMKKGHMAARLLRIMAAARGDADKAVRIARSPAWDDGNGDLVARALTAGVGADGGFLIPEEYSDEVIELLVNRTVIRRLGAATVPMPGGNLSIPRLQAGAAARYVGEAQASNASQQQFGMLNFAAKKLLALVPISNDLIKYPSPKADQVVLGDMLTQLAVAEDQAFLRGAGTQFSPRGIRNWAAAGNVTGTNGSTLAQITQDLNDLRNALELNNVQMINPAWVFNPRSANYIDLLQTTTGAFVFRDEMKTGKLLNYPFGKTNSVPANLGGGGNQTEIYLVDLNDAVIADVPGLDIAVSNEAAYVDSTGTMQAAFSQDVTLMRVIERHDFAMRHNVSAAVKTGVTY